MKGLLLKSLKALGACFVACGFSALAADSDSCGVKPAVQKVAMSDAELDAWKIAEKFRNRGFAIVEVATGDSSKPYHDHVKVPSEHDCVLMLGIDNSEVRPGLDLVVKDGSGRTLAEDKRSQSRACVAFSLPTAEGVEVFIQAPASTPLVHWALLMGLRRSYDVAAGDVEKMATKFRSRGYEFQSLGNGESTPEMSAPFAVELIKGMDCVVLAGVDGTASVDLVVKDPNGNVVAQDVRSIKRAAVEFSTSIAGTYSVTVSSPPKVLPGRFALLVGSQSAGPLKEP